MNDYVCAICGENAKAHLPVGDFEEVNCLKCGDYSINLTLIKQMVSSRQSFHTSRAQQFLVIMRNSGQPAIVTRLAATMNHLIVSGSRRA